MRLNPFADRSTDDYLPLFEHATPWAVLFKDGGVFSMFEVDGLAAQTLDAAALYRQRRHNNHALCGLASTGGLVLHSWVCRGFAPTSIYPAGQFRSRFARDLNERYRAKLMDRFLYLNKTYVGVTLRPGRPAGEWVGNKLDRWKAPRDVTDEAPIERIRRLRQACDILKADLEPYRPRQLGLRAEGGRDFTEVGEALIFAMTGVWRPVGLQAQHRIGPLFSERIIVGPEAIEIRGPADSSWAACFGAKHMPHNCPPGALDGFLTASFRSTVAQSWRIIGAQQALALMGRKQNRMASSGDRAISQIKSLDLAMDEVQSGRMAMGDHGLVVTVFSDDLASIRGNARDAWHILQSAGAQVAREDAALQCAYFSMLPGNARLRPRPAVVSSWNYASMASMHAFPAGAERGRWGEPMALFRTTGGTPYRYHVQSATGVGGTFVFGESGSGKSSWLAFIVTQCERLGVQVVLWDKDRGLEIVTRACGGRYLSLRNPTGVAFLKALTDSDEDVHHLAGLVRGMISMADGYKMEPEEDRRLFVGLRAIMALPPVDRWMADLRAFLGVSGKGAGARLERWCRGGEYGWVGDNPRDAVALDAHILGFDVTRFLDDPHVCGPIMSHLLFRAGKLADGRRILYIVDEGWRVVDIPAFSDDAMNHLKTDRKMNAAFIFGTQSVGDGLKSRIGHTIREQCKTVVAFGVERPDRREFKELRYTDRECDIIEDLKPGTGMFLLRQDGRSVVCQLPLAGLNDDLAVLSGNEANVRILDQVRGDGDDGDPERLIRDFHERRRVLA